MDLFRELRAENTRILRLAQLLGARSSRPEDRIAQLAEIEARLRSKSYVQRDFLEPLLMGHDDTRAARLAVRERSREVENDLDVLRAIPPEAHHFLHRAEALLFAVERLIEREERGLFPAAERLIDAEQRERLGAQAVERREQATRTAREVAQARAARNHTDSGAETQQGVLGLEGAVDRLWNRRRAAELARQLRGVHADGRLVGAPSSGEIADRDLAEAIVGALVRQAGVDANDVMVMARNGIVTLIGRVSSSEALHAALHAIEEAEGVRDVVGELEIEIEQLA